MNRMNEWKLIHFISLDWLIDLIDWWVQKANLVVDSFLSFSLSIHFSLSSLWDDWLIGNWNEIRLRMKINTKLERNKTKSKLLFLSISLIDWIELRFGFCCEIEIETLWRWICWKWKVWQISFHHSFILMIDWLIDWWDLLDEWESFDALWLSSWSFVSIISFLFLNWIELNWDKRTNDNEIDCWLICLLHFLSFFLSLDWLIDWIELNE